VFGLTGWRATITRTAVFGTAGVVVSLMMDIDVVPSGVIVVALIAVALVPHQMR
jgi:hypothetical protein